MFLKNKNIIFKFRRSKVTDYAAFRYDVFQKANNQCADQTARVRRLVCAFVVRKPPKTGFLASRPNYVFGA